jgi:hypothetical protein
MKKYKVEFCLKDKFVVDVLAKDEKEAVELAKKKWNKIEASGTEHYYQSGDPEMEVDTIYDVSETDDPFNP